MNVETKYASVGDANIAYQVIGQGEIDFVVVPCWLSHLDRMWREPRFARFIERLATFGRVITFDKRGTGLSDPVPSMAPYSLEDRMDDLSAVMDAAGSKQAVLFGVSVGARLSALYAATHPERVRGLVLYSASARGTWAPDYPWAPTPEEHERKFEHVFSMWGGPVWIERYAPSLAPDQDFRMWWAECLRSAGGPSAAVSMLRMEAESDIGSVLRSIKVPTLALHRTDDSVVNVEAGRHMASQIPNARFVELRGNDHLPFTGEQEPIFRELGRFVRDQLSALAPRRMLATAVAVSFAGAREAERRTGAEQWAQTRASLYAAIHSAHRRYRGLTSSFQGDGFVAAFDGPSRAIHFSREIVEEARRHGLRAQVGLHTGTVEHLDDSVGGLATELAVRIAAVARSGEIIVSGTVMGLVSGSGHGVVVADDRDKPGLPPGFRLFRVTEGGSASPPLEQRSVPLISGKAIVNLSPREREVAFCVARGLSNREIGRELSISVSTVERHVANILMKLGYRSRSQLSLWAAEQRQPVAPLPAVASLSSALTGYTASAAD